MYNVQITKPFTVYLTLVVFLLSFKPGLAQLNKDYVPIGQSASIPDDYVINLPQEVRKHVEASTLLKPNLAKSYYDQLFSLKKMIFERGDVYLPNPITLYLDSITTALLKTEPSLQTRIKVYLTRYSSSNAFCLADGSVFINIGMLTLLSNESELAFVIAHEIAHYALQHNVKDFLKVHEIERQETFKSGAFAEKFRTLRFSRESEQEADSYALSLMNSAGFDLEMASEALLKLKNKPVAELIDFKTLFNNSFFTLDTILYSKARIDKVKESLQQSNQDSPDSKIDDLYETHPDLDKRIGSVKELRRNIQPSQIKRHSTNYSYYKSIAFFERCYNNLREQDYLNTIVNSVDLLKKYPDNTFLLNCVSGSLYWLSYYKELSKEDLQIFGDVHQDPLNYCVLYLLFNKMNLKDSKQLAYAFLRSREDEISDKDTTYFYLAIAAENYLGKIAAKDFYRRYESKFPSGNYLAYVKTKTK